MSEKAVLELEPVMREEVSLPDPGERDTALQVQNLWKVFGPRASEVVAGKFRKLSKDEILEKTGAVLAVKDISFEVKRGEFFVLMGLSGSGKSTSIRMLLRLIEPTSGKIIIDGENICAYPREKLLAFRRQKMGMVFQHFGLFPHYTVLQNASYGLKIRKMPKEERLAKARSALETVGLSGWENYYPEALSGGMQQRVGLARALANDPEILLMDEPFSGLDPLIRRQMQDELVDLQDKLHKTIIFVTHDLHEALKLGDRIAIMRDGVIVQIGTPEEVITSPADDYVRAFTRDASPARVLTARSIMEEPELLLYEWEGPKSAQTILRRERKEWAFVVTKRRVLRGVVTLDDVDALIKRGGMSYQDVVKSSLSLAKPDQLIEELFSFAADSPYPIPVVDDDGRLLGDIPLRTIFDSISQNEEESVHV